MTAPGWLWSREFPDKGLNQNLRGEGGQPGGLGEARLQEVFPHQLRGAWERVGAEVREWEAYCWRPRVLPDSDLKPQSWQGKPGQPEPPF